MHAFFAEDITNTNKTELGKIVKKFFKLILCVKIKSTK